MELETMLSLRSAIYDDVLTFDCRQVVGDDVAWKYHSERHLARVLCGDCGRVGTSCACRAAAVRRVQGRAAVSG